MAMRIRLKEHQTYQINRSGDIAAARLIYRCNEISQTTVSEGEDLLTAVLRAVQTAAPLNIEAATRDTAELVKDPDADSCEVAVNYTPAARQNLDPKGQRKIGDEKWTFESTTGEVTINTAIEQVAVIDETPGMALSANLGNMIGWNGKFGAESACEGVGVQAPVTQFNCRRTVAAATATSHDFEANITSLRRKVNSATFHGYAAGEMLFLGATVGETYLNDDGDVVTDVNYRFLQQDNETAKTVAGLSFPAKNGWDYAWTITAYDPAEGKNIPVLGCVSRVYEYADLTGLGIGSSTP